MKLLIGDIGGTKTLLQIVDVNDTATQVIYESLFENQNFNDFESVLNTFLEQTSTETRQGLQIACFAVAGPVSNRQVRLTNIPWHLDALELATALGLQQVKLINDFQAIAYGIDMLGKDDLVDLQTGQTVPQATRLLLGAGTGLGQSIIVWCHDRYDLVLASEGGHVDFAPTDSLQWRLLEYLIPELGRVTCEHLISGPGLARIFDFLHKEEYGTPSQALLTAMRNGDPAEAISHFALNNKDMLTVKALDLFITLYGAHAGNLALTCLAKGGIYIAGGIAPKIINRLKEGGFIKAFCDKKPMAELLETVPVRVVMNSKVGLLGALRMATDNLVRPGL